VPNPSSLLPAQPYPVATRLVESIRHLGRLILTNVDWNVAYAGLIVNTAILGLVWWSPRIQGWV
jgi:hypothetical protein